MIKIYAQRDNSPVTPAVELITFPGGERHARLDSEGDLNAVHVLRLHHADANDLIQARMAASLLKDENPEARVHILLPYYPAARADHDQTRGLELYSDLVMPLTRYAQVYICDPHSDAVSQRLSGYVNVHPGAIRIFTAADLIAVSAVPSDYDYVIAPDEGARQRAGEVAECMGVPLVTATKHRDQHTGYITSYEVDIPSGGRALVVDDICDGGATFHILGRNLADAGVTADLWVTHPVFSGPKERLESNLSVYRMVYTTDSLPSYERMTDHLDMSVLRLDTALSDYLR